MSELHFIVPEGIDDPTRPSGGNTYDRRVSDELRALGWTVHEHAVSPGVAALAGALRQIPDGAVVLLDGLIASPAPEALVPESERLRQVVLVHMPFERGREHATLAAASAIVTTSQWTRRRLSELYALPLEKVFVAEPGVDAAELALGNAAGGALLCVAAVTPGKGHEVLLDALAMAKGLSWRCTCVGSLDRDPGHADTIRRRAQELGDRVRFTGPRTGPELDHAYATTDLLVLPSHAETYGIVLTEALARGVPVLATGVGGVREAVGDEAGLIVPPGDPAALGAALRAWLEDPALRARLRHAARGRRSTLRAWAATASDLAGVLERVGPLVGAAR